MIKNKKISCALPRIKEWTVLRVIICFARRHQTNTYRPMTVALYKEFENSSKGPGVKFTRVHKEKNKRDRLDPLFLANDKK